MAHQFKTQAAMPVPAPARQQEYRLPIRHTYPFIMGIHPKSWWPEETDQGFQWVPRLKKLWERPGVNGVTRIGGGDEMKNPPDSTLMQAEARRFAWLTFPNENWDLPPEILAMDELPDDAGGNYMVRYPARRGFLYCFRWELPQVVGDGVAWRENTAQRWAVQRWLLDSGQVPPPDTTIIDNVLRIKRKRIERARKNPHDPMSVDEAERSEAELDAWQKALTDTGLAQPLDITSKKKDLLARARSMGIDVPSRATKADILKAIKETS